MAAVVLSNSMESPLEGIAFLARSENRVAVLRSIVDAPRTRGELRDELDVPRTTLARILNEFEGRGLTTSDGRRYDSTPAAEEILAKFLPLLETMEAIRHLDEAIDWLPPPARALDVRHFRDADVTTSQTRNPSEPFDYALEMIRSSSSLRFLAFTAAPRYVEAFRDRAAGEEWDAEGVMEAGFFESIREEGDRMSAWYDLADVAATFVHHDRVPISMFVLDESVLVWLGDRRVGKMDVYGILESSNPAVQSWAESLYEEYRERADPLDRSMFSRE